MNLTVVACVLVVLGAAGLAWRGSAAASRAEGELAVARGRIGELEQQLAAARAAPSLGPGEPRNVAEPERVVPRAEPERPPGPGRRPGHMPDFSNDP